MTALDKDRLEVAREAGRVAFLSTGGLASRAVDAAIDAAIASALSHVTPSTDRGGEPVGYGRAKDIAEHRPTSMWVNWKKNTYYDTPLYLAPPTSDAIRAGAFEAAAKAAEKLGHDWHDGEHDGNGPLYQPASMGAFEIAAAIRSLAKPTGEGAEAAALVDPLAPGERVEAGETQSAPVGGS